MIGSLNYVRTREETKDMQIHLHSMCLGANATLVAMRKQPQLFDGVKSMMLIQPISGDALVRRLCKNMRLTKRGYQVFEQKYREIWGFSISDSSPIRDAPYAKMPTFVSQVKDDAFTYSDDVQGIYDAIFLPEKELFWIEGTTQRFRGYTYFSEHPEQMIDWYNQHA